MCINVYISIYIYIYIYIHIHISFWGAGAGDGAKNLSEPCNNSFVRGLSGFLSVADKGL